RVLGVLARVRDDVLRDDRLPRRARRGGADPDARRVRSLDPGRVRRRRAPRRRGRGLLLALRRRRVDRAVRDAVPAAMSARSGRTVARWAIPIVVVAGALAGQVAWLLQPAASQSLTEQEALGQRLFV